MLFMHLSHSNTIEQISLQASRHLYFGWLEIYAKCWRGFEESVHGQNFEAAPRFKASVKYFCWRVFASLALINCCWIFNHCEDRWREVLALKDSILAHWLCGEWHLSSWHSASSSKGVISSLVNHHSITIFLIQRAIGNQYRTSN